MLDDLVEILRNCAGNPAPCAECPMHDDDACTDDLLYQAANAVEKLRSEIEKYRHAAFVIGETCVDADKCHIAPEAALQKIRENIYYTRHECKGESA